MSGKNIDLFILIHGLFFMTLNQVTNNLEILAPKITDHHFVGGVRGSRNALTTDQDFTQKGLLGGIPQFPNNNPTMIPQNIKGSILQFTRDETKVGDFADSTHFVGKIILPWPKEFFSLRCSNRATTFRFVPGSIVGQKIENNCKGKSPNVGIVTCLQYEVEDTTTSLWPSGLNFHFYLQPCMPHTFDEVNDDLKEASKCFTKPNFDLQLVDPNPPVPTTPIGQNNCNDAPSAIPPEDEQSLDEENTSGAPDVNAICTSSSATSHPLSKGNENGGTSPANCPTFYVG